MLWTLDVWDVSYAGCVCCSAVAVPRGVALNVVQTASPRCSTRHAFVRFSRQRRFLCCDDLSIDLLYVVIFLLSTARVFSGRFVAYSLLDDVPCSG